MLRGSYREGAAGLLFMRALVRVVFAAAAGGLMAAGCTTSGMPSLDIGALGAAPSSGTGPRTVAFEWIDGPPPAVFSKLTSQLAQEANARKLAVVSNEQPSQYRIDAFMAAHVQGQKTTITWVWDVSTADHQRVVRFSGEVPGAPSERAWAAADDAVVARVAQDGMSRLAAFLDAAGPAPRDSSANVASSAAAGPLAFLPSRP